MPVDKIVPLIRAGRLDEAIQVCLEDHAATPRISQTVGLSETDPTMRKLLDIMNQGHIREMFWIAAAAVKAQDWPRAAKIGKLIQEMPGLADDERSTAITLSLLTPSALENQKYALQQFLKAEMSRLPEATPALTELLEIAKSDDTDAIANIILNLRETLQEQWVPTMERDMQAKAAEVQDQTKASPQPVASRYTPVETPRKRSLNITRALIFPLSNRVGLLIGGVLLLIPIIGWWILQGYMLEIMRRMISQDCDVMPDWSDIGTKLKEGFMATVIGIIWSLPVGVISVMPPYLSSLSNPGRYVSESSMMIAGILFYLMLFLMLFFHPVIFGRYAETRQLKSGLQIGIILGMIRRNFGSYIGNWGLAAVIIVLAVVFAQLAGMAACGVGLIVTLFYGIALTAYMYGHLYAIAKC